MDQGLEIDPRNGFNSSTKTFHSLRPPVDLTSEDTPLSAATFAFTLRLNSPLPDSVALISSSTGQRILYSEFEHRSKFLAANLQNLIGLSKGDAVFVLSENSIKIPILYFSLLTLGVVISPANPISTESEITRLTQLSKPVIAFATKSTAHKLKRLHIKTILIDSLEFDELTTSSSAGEFEPVEVSQSDLATIMYSLGTTGKVKGVMSTHRNLIAMVAGSYAHRTKRKSPAVVLYTMPYFHMFGFFYCAKSVAMSETVVVMERFELKKMLRNVEKYRVTHVAVVPPIVVAMAKGCFGGDCDLSSLETVICGAAPLSKDVIQAFKAKFLDVLMVQVIVHFYYFNI